MGLKTLPTNEAIFSEEITTQNLGGAGWLCPCAGGTAVPSSLELCDGFQVFPWTKAGH